MYSAQWPLLDRFSMLLINNNRSKAYLQVLLNKGYIPSHVLILESGAKRLPEHTESDLNLHIETMQKLVRFCLEANISFDEKENILHTVKKHGISYQTIATIDVNSVEVIDALRALPEKYIVYSGPGGAILRHDILSTEKIFLHVHPGWLPDYRGSTVIYYAILANNAVGCSVIALVEDIDKGPIFYRQSFQASQNSNLDYVFDPAIRAATLLEFFNLNINRSPVPIVTPNNEGQLFFIIHPILKHLSILSLENKC